MTKETSITRKNALQQKLAKHEAAMQDTQDSIDTQSDQIQLLRERLRDQEKERKRINRKYKAAYQTMIDTLQQELTDME